MENQQAVPSPTESKQNKYERVFVELQTALLEKGGDSASEQVKQKTLSEVVSRNFKDFNFVGFYDLKEGDNTKLYIGEFVSELVFPCGEIKMGKGQCGQCASEQRVMIAQNVKELENYIACDDDTQSEIVLPCFVTNESGERKLRTVLDIDSPNLATFDEEDQQGLERLISLIYP
eukprot:403350112